MGALGGSQHHLGSVFTVQDRPYSNSRYPRNSAFKHSGARARRMDRPSPRRGMSIEHNAGGTGRSGRVEPASSISSMMDRGLYPVNAVACGGSNLTGSRSMSSSVRRWLASRREDLGVHLRNLQDVPLWSQHYTWPGFLGRQVRALTNPNYQNRLPHGHR